MPAQYKFEIYKDNEGKFRFRFVASNGETMFHGQGYSRKQSVLQAIESIKKNAPDAALEDQTKES